MIFDWVQEMREVEILRNCKEMTTGEYPVTDQVTDTVLKLYNIYT